MTKDKQFVKDVYAYNYLRRENYLLRADMEELEQENMDKEDENAALLQRLLAAREETHNMEELDKAFQYDLAEENAQLRKQLGEKHDDNCRLQRHNCGLQRRLAEEHNNMVLISNELVDALEVKEDLEQSTLSAQVRNSNAEVKVDDLTEENAILQRRVVSLAYRMDSLEEQLDDGS